MTRAPDARELEAATPHLPLLLYDGACPFCRDQARRLRPRDGSRLRVEPLQTGLAHVPWIDPQEAATALHVIDVDGRRYVGAAAVVRALRLTRPVLGSLALAYHLPGVRWLAERAYAFVAARRYGLRRRADGSPHACADDGCGTAAATPAGQITSTGRPARSSVRSKMPPKSDSSQREYR